MKQKSMALSLKTMTRKIFSSILMICAKSICWQSHS